MKRKQVLFLALALLLLLIAAVSCAPPRRPGEVPPAEPQQYQAVPRRPGGPGADLAPGRPQGVPRPGTPRRRFDNMMPGWGGNMTQRAEQIAETVAEEDEVDAATCVISGNTALVGIQLDDAHRDRLTDAVKQRIDQKVRQEDQRIRRVVVTADPDLVTRIENMFREIGRGRPITGFSQEIQEMLNRIQPR